MVMIVVVLICFSYVYLNVGGEFIENYLMVNLIFFIFWFRFYDLIDCGFGFDFL